MTIDIRRDDLSSTATQNLIASHLSDMHAGSPAESVHALDLSGLRHPSITFWSAWNGEQIAGIGALRVWHGAPASGVGPEGEIKSMRVADEFRGAGVGRALLNTILNSARERGMTRLWLETGSADSFAPARQLYARAGFVECGPFADYRPDPLSVFMTLALAPSRSAART